MKAILLAALLSLAATATAVAGTHPLTVVVNGPATGITNIKVDGGEVTKPPPTKEQKSRTEFTVHVTLPDGACTARVSFFFGPGDRRDTRMNLCGGVRITVY